jgi:hypothetical protein
MGNLNILFSDMSSFNLLPMFCLSKLLLHVFAPSKILTKRKRILYYIILYFHVEKIIQNLVLQSI